MLDIRQLNQGMSSDNAPSFQPPGTYPYALNAVVETSTGDHGGLSNELGNTLVSYLGNDYTIVGSCNTDKDSTVLFLHHSDGNHRISEFNPNTNSLTTLIQDPCLNFDVNAFVQTSFHIQDCDRWIYFSDKLNPFRAINIDRISYYTKTFSGTTYVCDRLAYSKYFPEPNVELEAKEFTSNLKNGLYYVSTRYLDSFGNYSDWSTISRPICLGLDGSQYASPQTHNFYHGTHDLVEEPADKIIKVNLSNLLQINWDSIQVAFIPRVTDSGALGEVMVTYPVEFDSTTASLEFGGFDSQILYTTSIDEILSSTYKPHIVNAHTILNDRLYLAGNEKERDYSSYQRFASKIKVEYILDPTDGLLSADPTSDQESSFLDDEVYALGAYYKHTDGTNSPVFHIPGRPANNVTGSNPLIGTNGVATSGGAWDTGVGNHSFPLLDIFPDTERWRQISTATDDGELGYYETSTNYPSIPTCTIHPDGYWGRDYTGALLVNTPIRHHRMPSFDAFQDGRIKLKFTNVELPPDTVGIFYVYGDRSFERTILDRGILIPHAVKEVKAHTLTPKNYTSTLPPYASDWLFLSSQQLLLNKFYQGAYVKFSHYVVDPSPATATFTETDTLVSKNYTTEMFDFLDYQTFSSGVMNYNIEDYSILRSTELGLIPNPTIFGGVEFTNNSINTSYGLFKLTKTVEAYTNKVPIVSIKSNQEVYANLNSIRYKPMKPLMNLLETFAGDAFSSRVNVTDYEFNLSSNPWVIKAYHISYKVLESHVRYPLRASSSSKEFKTFQNDYSHSTNTLARYVYSKAYPLSSDPYTGDYSIYPERYLYRKSYSYTDSVSELLPLPFTYNYCSSCDPLVSTRVHFSDFSDTDSNVNNMFKIRTNNYAVLPTGINGLISNFSELYALTQESAWKIPTRVQQLVTQDTSVYLGTPNIIGIPYRLNPSDSYFSGSTQSSSICSTEFGTAYADDLTGKIILLSRDLNDLSKVHLRNFFAENGTLKLLEQFPSYPHTQYVGPNGIGYRISYDIRYKRLIITKKDYKARFPYATTYTNGFFYYNSNPIVLGDPEYFTNESFTISYSLLTNYWASFHSYIPDYHFSSKLKHFSSYNSSIYSSNTGAYQTYYGIKRDFILDVIFPHTLNNKTTSIKLKVATPYSPSAIYDRMIVYNSHQVSPLASLSNRVPLDYSSSYLSADIFDMDNILRINQFRDYSINNLPIWLKSNTPSIDKELNPARVSNTKSLFDLPRFADTYTGVRLYSNTPDNIKIVNELIMADSTNRTR